MSNCTNLVSPSIKIQTKIVSARVAIMKQDTILPVILRRLYHLLFFVSLLLKWCTFRTGYFKLDKLDHWKAQHGIQIGCLTGTQKGTTFCVCYWSKEKIFSSLSKTTCRFFQTVFQTFSSSSSKRSLLPRGLLIILSFLLAWHRWPWVAMICYCICLFLWAESSLQKGSLSHLPWCV